MNILLTSVGRRAYLVGFFKEALKGRGQVVATNTIAETTGMFAADSAVVVPPANAPGFIDRLLDVCRSHEISLLCSLHDWEAPYIAKNAKKFEEIGVRLAIPSIEIVETCLDKYKTFLFAQKLGIPTPKTYLSVEAVSGAIARQEVAYPLILKPRWGQGSIGIRYASSLAELASAYELLQLELKAVDLGHLATAPLEQIVCQECLVGQECGVDIVNTLDGDFAACFVKKKLGMRAGETDSAITTKQPLIESICRKLSESTRHSGNLDADFFELENGDVVLLELNPRFGGGYPFSHLAGANVPAALIAWAEGREPCPSWLSVSSGVRGFKDVRVVGVPE
ncbi:MAG: ATP-grasp domain-containing protein [Lentimonas sp.]